MKKIVLLLGCVAMLFATTATYATNITRDEARVVAATKMASVFGHPQADYDLLNLVKEYTNPATGNSSLYVYSYSGKGFVVVPGTMALNPILAYGDDGVVTASDLEAEGSPFAAFMNFYANMASECQTYNVADDANYAQQWKDLLNGVSPRKATKANNIILVKAKWSQSAPYNSQTPQASGCSDPPVGCVALSMAMVMHYWQYPVVGNGSNTDVVASLPITINFDEQHYDYSLMPNDLKTTSPQAEIDETSKLCFHCGIAANSQYTCDGTGSGMPPVVNAMTNFFKYSGHRVVSRSSMTNINWLNLLKDEIVAGRPLIMMASSIAETGTPHDGHSFLVCGYKPDEQKFRLNWGWGGTGNAWYDMTVPEDLIVVAGATYIYAAGQTILANLMPPTDSIHVELPNPADYPDPIVSIENAKSNEASFSTIYPSPASEMVNIPYTLRGVSEAQLDIYNVQGALVESRRVSATNNLETINVQRYPAGIYTCRLRGASRNFIVR